MKMMSYHMIGEAKMNSYDVMVNHRIGKKIKVFQMHKIMWGPLIDLTNKILPHGRRNEER